MGGTWRGSMLAALAATLARPAWWSMALAAFLVRGGFVLVLLPIVVLPTPAALTTALAPTIEALAFGGLTPERITVLVIAVAVFGLVLALAGLAGAWLDLAQLAEAAADEELEVRWTPAHASVRDALALRLTAHLPTLAALGYASVRLVVEAYAELLSPGDTATPVVLRVAARAPDAIIILLLTWLAGETVGALAARRAAAGAGVRDSLWRSTLQLLTARGLATLALTTVVVAGAVLPFLLAASRAWDLLREALIGGGDLLEVGVALLLLMGTWTLGLAVVGAVLAWRGAAWTAEVATVPGVPPDRAVTRAPGTVRG